MHWGERCTGAAPMPDNAHYPTTPTPRYDQNDPRNPSAVADAIADLADQVARVANALEYQLNVNPSTFPKSSAQKSNSPTTTIGSER